MAKVVKSRVILEKPREIMAISRVIYSDRSEMLSNL